MTLAWAPPPYNDLSNSVNMVVMHLWVSDHTVMERKKKIKDPQWVHFLKFKKQWSVEHRFIAEAIWLLWYMHIR